MIGRLEQRGLVERRAVDGDRRVKEVVLTPLGVKTKADLLEAFHKPPPESEPEAQVATAVAASPRPG
jgi:DNA-binding MarR family transcriptional regulator